MIILVLRTDRPEAEIGLCDDEKQLAHKRWQAHRLLAETLHRELHDLLTSKQLEWHDIQGVVVYQGPGSFTGLRIGISVANALAVSLHVPVVGVTGDHWIDAGVKKLQQGAAAGVVLPDYGGDPHITQQKK